MVPPRSRARFPAACLLAPLAAAGAAGAAEPLRLSYEEGLARDPASGAALYREQHLVRRLAGRLQERLVLYRCLDGTAFARKRVDYRDSLVAPAFALEDARRGYGEGLRRAGSATLWVRDGAGRPERRAVVAAAALVADAGFDEFVRRHWSALHAGDSVALRFAVPARLQGLSFQVRRIGDGEVGGEPASRLQLRLGGWLGWIAPAIEVAYGRDSRRLLRFEGLSNLREDDGERQLTARIDFPRPPVATGEAQWQAFAAETLASCRTRP